MRSAFDTELKNAEATSDWRPIDDILLVPGIPWETRAKLVDRVRKLPGSSIPGKLQASPLMRAGVPSRQVTAAPPASGSDRPALTHNVGRWLFDKANAALDPRQPASAAPNFEPDWIYDQVLRTDEDPTYRPIAAGTKRLAAALERLGPAPDRTSTSGSRGS